MNIYGIALVNNEDDIIGETLLRATSWCDQIFIYDTGGEDNSWEIVLKLSRKCPKIVPFKKAHIPFRDGLRAQVFNEYRTVATSAD